ncbi:hypothetical protein EPYR_01335 [Erwinia pyrifoliae DSM 12163]|nr:hypothetical protein EPYR_01335 [Erwinia pyrifoliae DSM 12163]
MNGFCDSSAIQYFKISRSSHYLLLINDRGEVVFFKWFDNPERQPDAY